MSVYDKNHYNIKKKNGDCYLYYYIFRLHIAVPKSMWNILIIR